MSVYKQKGYLFRKVSVLGVVLLIASLLYGIVATDAVGLFVSPVEAQTPYEVSFAESAYTVWESAGTVTVTLQGNRVKQTSTTVSVSTVPNGVCGAHDRYWTDKDVDGDVDVFAVDALNNPVTCGAGYTQTDTQTGVTETVNDYTVLTGHQVTIPAGAQSVDIPISIFNDRIRELGDPNAGIGEDFKLKVVAVDGTTVCDGVVACDSAETTITILDDERILVFEEASHLVYEDAGTKDITLESSRPLPFDQTYGLTAVALGDFLVADVFTIPERVTLPANEKEVTVTLTIKDNDKAGESHKLIRITVDHGSTLPSGNYPPVTDFIVADDGELEDCGVLPIVLDEGENYIGGACVLPSPWSEQTGNVRGQYKGLNLDRTEVTDVNVSSALFWGIGKDYGRMVLAWGGSPPDDNIVHGDHAVSATLGAHTGDIFVIKDDDISNINVTFEPQHTWEAKDSKPLTIYVPLVHPAANIHLGYQTLTITPKKDLGGTVDVSFYEGSDWKTTDNSVTYTAPSGGSNGTLQLVRRYPHFANPSDANPQHIVHFDAYAVAEFFDYVASTSTTLSEAFTVVAGGALRGVFHDRTKCTTLETLGTVCDATVSKVPVGVGGAVEGPQAAGFTHGVITVRTDRAVTMLHNGDPAEATLLFRFVDTDGNPRFPSIGEPGFAITGIRINNSADKMFLDQPNTVRRFKMYYRLQRNVDEVRPYTCADGPVSLQVYVSSRVPYYEYVSFVPEVSVKNIQGYDYKMVEFEVCPQCLVVGDTECTLQ